MSDNASSTFIGDNTHGSTLNQGSIITGDGSHVGNINHFHTATQEDSARKSCLRDLLAALGDDPDDYRQMLEDRKGPKTLGTCEWVSETDAYKSWIAKSSSLLWISGDAGKGKTMLSLHLVSSLKRDSSAAHVVHFFCSRDHGRNNGASILRGLIYQLLSQRASLFKHVLDDYDKHGTSLFGTSGIELISERDQENWKSQHGSTILDNRGGLCIQPDDFYSYCGTLLLPFPLGGNGHVLQGDDTKVKAYEPGQDVLYHRGIGNPFVSGWGTPLTAILINWWEQVENDSWRVDENGVAGGDELWKKADTEEDAEDFKI